MTQPTDEGFYWAKWKIIEDGSSTGGAPSGQWEVVEVFLNGDDDDFRVFVGGEKMSQPLENFYWGKTLHKVGPPPISFDEATP